MSFYGADRLLLEYFTLRLRLTGAPALMPSERPSVPVLVGASDALHSQLASLGWFVKDLTDDELRMCAARLLGFGGTTRTLRYVRSGEELEADELPTGQSHPDDPECFEVCGTAVKPPTYPDLAKHFGLRVAVVAGLLASARRKVHLRMQERREARQRGQHRTPSIGM